jgi:hypothetical protein
VTIPTPFCCPLHIYSVSVKLVLLVDTTWPELVLLVDTTWPDVLILRASRSGQSWSRWLAVIGPVLQEHWAVSPIRYLRNRWCRILLRPLRSLKMVTCSAHVSWW